MSLLFEHAVDGYALADAALSAPASEDLDPAGPDVPVRPIAEFASHHGSLTHPEHGWTCIPLHDPDGAAPTGEYVGYTEHDLRGPIFVVEGDDGHDSIPAEEFGETALANRIRFWHSDFLPETMPPGYDAPIADHEEPRNPTDTAELLAEFADYVENERDATRDANRDRARSRSARAIYEQGGGAIPALQSRGVEDGTYQFRVDLDSSLEDRRDGDWAFFVEDEFGIHEGNEVLVHAPAADAADAPDAFPVAAEVEKIRGLNVWLTLDWTDVEDSALVRSHLTGDRSVGVSELCNPVPFDREQDAIDDLSDHRLAGVLAGERPVSFSHDAAARSESFDTDLNQEQQLAVTYALLADDLFCIHGPPGTGKSRTLLEIVRRAADAGEDVLVCADSNQAVDNLVAGSSTRGDPDEQSLHAYGQHGAGEFVLDRANAERSQHALVRQQYGDVADRPQVVAATNSSAATIPREFDLVVLDEATQSTCTASCIPLSKADRVVLAGDHRQLPPFSATEEPPASSYGLSLFEHLYAEGGVYEGVGLQLKTQYRMHRDIASFPNRAFYDRSLRNGRTVDPLPDRPAIEGYNIGGSVDVVDHSRANETEARMVVHLVTDLLNDVSADEIGIITPYTAQVRLLERSLADHTDVADAVTVDTIDSFQGSEKTAIVISLVRSNSEGDVGFLGRPEDGPRRLNVALTRAKRYCAVVGDFHTFRYDHDDKCVDLYEDFYSYFDTILELNHVDPAFLPV
ncbi:AAA domain-containing protein [Haloarchaeobius amylolyticus]|uniref:AAA domain-containing protein n=1 Tax=Haloarchaeobius amylolyticus TaxID=1198296 RepID=UPI00226F8FD7|nr:AAA domain-containing protein [Haloarchaeobius amylolyticus]